MYTLAELAEYTGGSISGDSGVQIRKVRPFENAESGDITLAVSTELISKLKDSRASAVIVPMDVGFEGKPLLHCMNPKLAFAQILSRFTVKPFQSSGISPNASIGENCRISSEVRISDFVSIGKDSQIGDRVTIESGSIVGENCRIGNDSTLHPNVTLYPGTTLGERVIIHSGTVIGADGFGYVFDGEKQFKVPQVGSVEICDDVEIGANSCVDRATFGKTIIHKGVKLDNHVHIAHNCSIGENTIIVGAVGISGSVKIGKNCLFAGQSGTVDHVTIGDNVIVMAKTAVTKDVPSGSRISGTHGRDHRQQLKIEAILRRLPEIYKEWKQIKASQKA